MGFNDGLDFSPSIEKLECESAPFNVILSSFLRLSRTFEMYDRLAKREAVQCRLIPFELPNDSLAPVRLGELLGALRANENFLSIMVSDPYKQSIQEFVSQVLPRAAKCGAINVVLKSNDLNLGDNFDGDAFFDGVTKELEVDFHGKTMVFFGCGGVSSAVSMRLVGLLSRVYLIDPDSVKVNELMVRLRNENTNLAIERLPVVGGRDFRRIDFLYNGTGLGKSNTASPLNSSDRFDQAGTAFDANYTPDSTPFLQTLSRLGYRTHNGLSHMLSCTSMHLSAVSRRPLSYDTIKSAYQDLNAGAT